MRYSIIILLACASCGAMQKKDKDDSSPAAADATAEQASEFQTMLKGTWADKSGDNYYRFTPIGTGSKYFGKREVWCSDCYGESLFEVKSKEEFMMQDESWIMWTIQNYVEMKGTTKLAAICHKKTDNLSSFKYLDIYDEQSITDKCFGSNSKEYTKETEATK